MHLEIPYPDIDPAIHLGPLTLHWYGVMYLVGFVVGYLLGRHRARKPEWGWTEDEVTDLVLYAALGVVLGGRLGYAFFYNLPVTLSDPVSILRVNEGGMSFHGGLIGVLVAMWLFKKKTAHGFWETMDFVAPLVPAGLGFGRIGNFINGELWGAPTDLPWAMRFPTGGDVPRHPSMLYEALLEGLVLFVLLWWISRRRPPIRAVSGWFLIFYGAFRFLVEFVRTPDAHIGYLAGGWFTMGMLLTVPMILGGIVLLWLAYLRPFAVPEDPESDDPQPDPETRTASESDLPSED